MDLMLSDMEHADELYSPTKFWESGLNDIISEIKVKGMNNFRSHDSAHFYYVPLYSEKLKSKDNDHINNKIIRNLESVGSGRIGRELNNIINGQTFAISDYKMFMISDKVEQEPLLMNLSESEFGKPYEQFQFHGKLYSKSFLNYLRMVTCLKVHCDTSNIKTVFEIGGGYGTLGEILLKSKKDSFYLNIDIPPLAMVSSYYLSNVFGRNDILTYEKSRELDCIDIEKIKNDYRGAVICPWQLPILQGEFDLFINSISFQEMEPKIVKNYLQIIQKITKQFILLRSSKFGKRKVSKDVVGVITPIHNDSIVEMIDKFSLLKRDSFFYGFENPIDEFFSEVMCFERKV